MRAFIPLVLAASMVAASASPPVTGSPTLRQMRYSPDFPHRADPSLSWVGSEYHAAPHPRSARGLAWAPAGGLVLRGQGCGGRQRSATCGLKGLRAKILSDEAAVAVKDVIPSTAEWVKGFIVALKICPFAKEPLNKGTIR